MQQLKIAGAVIHQQYFVVRAGSFLGRIHVLRHFSDFLLGLSAMGLSQPMLILIRWQCKFLNRKELKISANS
jgi:hypothetical protein